MSTEEMKQEVEPQVQQTFNLQQANANIQNRKDQVALSNKQDHSRTPQGEKQVIHLPQYPQNTIAQGVFQIEEESIPTEQKKQVTQFQPSIPPQSQKQVQSKQNNQVQTPLIQYNNISKEQNNPLQAELQIKQEIQVIQNDNFILKGGPSIMESVKTIQSKPFQENSLIKQQTATPIQNQDQPSVIQKYNKEIPLVLVQNQPSNEKIQAKELQLPFNQPVIISIIPQNQTNKEQTIVQGINITPNEPQEKKAEPFEAQKIQPSQLNQHEEKSKYRLNSEFVESIQQEKENKIIQFVQFSPNEDNKQVHVQKSTQKNQLNFSFSERKEMNDEQHHQSSRQSPNPRGQKGQSPHRKVIGKITKKALHEKKVHNAIVNLQKHDEKKIVIPTFEQSKKTGRKIDLSKLQSQITLNSNILSLTIGEIITKDEDEATKLLQQIKELKKKLYSIQMAKKEQEDQEEEIKHVQQKPSTPVQQYASTYNHLSPQKNYLSIQQQSVLSNKHKKRQNLGKIYQKVQYNNSRITEQLEAAGIMTERRGTNIMSSEQNKFSARQKYPSTQDFELVLKSNNKQKTIQNKTGPVTFRVRKNSKHIITPYANNQQTQAQFGTRLQSKDQWFQAKRQHHPKPQVQQEKLKPIEKPIPRELPFQQNFIEYVNKYFIDLGDQQIKRNSNQEELVELAKQTFKKFGFNLQNNKQSTLHVKKYKNCVSFIADISKTVLWYYEGKFYYGGWIINGQGEGEKSGWGYDYCPGKFVYSGNFRYNKREGYGIMKFLTKENDSIYEGYWKNGFKNGLGKQKEADGSVFIGQWREGKKNGKGKLVVSQTQYFDGNHLNGVKDGSGNEKFGNGDSYEGNYLEGKFHGLGTYTWANHSRYEGQFRSGSRNGNGIWVSDERDPQSDSYEGQYLNDKKSGFGLYKWKDGTTYEGQFLNDLKHGQGIVTYANGKSTHLQWFQGNIVEQKNKTQRSKSIKNSGSNYNSQRSQDQQKDQRKNPLLKFSKKLNFKSKAARVTLNQQI